MTTRISLGATFFLLTVLVIPGLPAGALVGRWGLLSITAAILFFRTEMQMAAAILLLYSALMGCVTSVGYEAMNLYCHLAILVILYCYAQNLDNLRPIIIGAALGFWINSAAVIAQEFGWHGIPQLAPDSGLFYNRNMACESAAIVLAGVVGYRVWWLIPGIVPTLVFGSRAPILALGVAGFIHLWKKSEFWAMMAVLSALLIIFGWMHNNSGLETLMQRFDAWHDAAHGLTFFGRGLGSFIVDFPLFQVHSNTLDLRWENAHNDMLQIVFELGIGGAILVALFLLRLACAPRQPEFYCLVVFVVEGFFGFPLYEPLSGALAAVCAGRLFGLSPSLRDLLLPVGLRIRAWLAHLENRLFPQVLGSFPSDA